MSAIGIVDPPEDDGPSTLRWRFGQPETSHQHHASWLPNGRVLVYDNGMRRLQDLAYSRILSIDPEADEFDVVCQGMLREQCFSARISGVSQLSSGSYLVTEGAAGRLFEVDAAGGVVWEWVSPLLVRQRGDTCNWVFRAWRCDGGYSGLAGRELGPERRADFNRLRGLLE